MESSLEVHMYEDTDDANRSIECNCKGVMDTWKVLGKRWSLLILRSLDSKESIRFNELKRILSGISSTVLADRLLELEQTSRFLVIHPSQPRVNL